MSTVGGPDWPETLALIWCQSAEPVKESDVEAAMKAAGLTAGNVVSIELGPEPTNPGIWRVSWDETQSDPDWEPDHAIISRLRENERQCLGRIAALEADNVTLTEELGTAHGAIAWLERKLAGFAAFTDDPPDLPDPPRRPDGTLMPQPKALTVPRETGDKRRIGG